MPARASFARVTPIRTGLMRTLGRAALVALALASVPASLFAASA